MKTILSSAIALSVGLCFGASNLAAQAQSTVPTAEARAFVGSWEMPIEGPQPVTLAIDITDDGGQLAASVIGLAGTPTPVPRISKNGEALVLDYSIDVQGQTAPVRIRLTPNGDGLSGSLDLGQGLFTADGTATRK